MLSSGSRPIQPGHVAPKSSAPEACSAANARPSCSAAAGVGAPESIHDSSSIDSVTATTSGTDTHPHSPSHRSPAASLPKKPAAAPARDLAKTELPSSRVSRSARQVSPPGSGVVRIR